MVMKIKKTDVIGVLVFILVMLWSASPYQTIYPAIENLQVPLAFVLFILSFSRIHKGCFASFYSVSIIVFMIMIFLTWTVYLFEVPTVYMKEACFIFLAFAFTQLFDFQTFVQQYLKIITFVAVISLIGYLLVNNTTLLHSLPSVANRNGVLYNIGFVFNFLTEYPERNCGIFWEPGIYASFLVLAIIFDTCFGKQKGKIFREIVFFVTLLTTNSSAGFVLFVLCIMFVYINRTQRTKPVFGAVVGTCLLIIVILLLVNLDSIVLFFLNYFDNQYLKKLLSDNIMNNARYLGFMHNLQVFGEHPLFGAGLTGVARRMQHVADISTSTYLMSKYGLLGSFYTICWIVGVFKQKSLKNYLRIILVSILLIIVNKETHSMILFSWMLMFYLLKQDNFNKQESVQKIDPR